MKVGKNKAIKSTGLIIKALPVITKNAQKKGVEIQKLDN